MSILFLGAGTKEMGCVAYVSEEHAAFFCRFKVSRVRKCLGYMARQFVSRKGGGQK